MTEAWLSYIDRSAARVPGHREARFAAMPDERTRGQRVAQWAATAVSVACAVLGVLIVSVAAVVLGLA
jgi:hypothetical protein